MTMSTSEVQLEIRDAEALTQVECIEEELQHDPQVSLVDLRHCDV